MSKKADKTQQLQEELELLKYRVRHIEGFLSTFTSPHFKVAADSDNTDELLTEAIQAVAKYQRASASLLQRQLGIGYARAARILDQLVEAGLVSAFDGSSNPREIYQDKIDEYQKRLSEKRSTRTTG